MKATNWEELRDRFFKEWCLRNQIGIDITPKVFEWFKNQFKEDRQDKGLRWEFPEHEKVVITNSNGDTYTSKSEELIDFLMSSELKDRQAGIEDETIELFDFVDAPQEQKEKAINEITFTCCKVLMQAFMSFGLKTHIEQMVIDDNSKKEFILSFRPVEEHLKRFLLLNRNNPDIGLKK